MDRAKRLVVFAILSLFVFVALLLPSIAHAIGDVPPQPSMVWRCSGPAGYSSTVFSGSSPETACGAAFSQTTATRYLVFVRCYGAPYQVAGDYKVTTCFYAEKSKDGSSLGGGSLSTQGKSEIACPENSTALPGANNTISGCACNPLHMPVSGKCQQYTCPPSGSYTAVTQPDQKVGNAGETVCTGGCSYQPSSWKVGNDGQIWATWPFKSTGSFCRGDPDANKPGVDSGEKNSKNPAPIPCGTNQCPGTVNGQAICVPCKGQQEQGPSTSASAPSGAASGTQTGSSDTSTTCNGINCTTTTTTKDANGNVTGTVEKSEKQESFCKENPTSALCKQSSFGGQCGAVTCEGDAIQCAIAADQYRRNCQWFDDEAASQLATVGNAAITGQIRPDGHPGNSPDSQSISFSSTIDQTDRLGAGCPVDVSVNVGGKSVAIPFSSMCGNLQLVGNLMVGFCMFVAALIVFRS